MVRIVDFGLLSRSGLIAHISLPITLGMSAASGPLDFASFHAVLVAAKEGKEWAVEQLFVDLQPRLLRFLQGLEAGAADDLAGEVWLAMARGITGFEGDLIDFRAWVFTIARRRAADYRRSAARRPSVPVEHEFFDGLTGTNDTAAEAVESLSGHDAAVLITASLPEEQAEVLLLRVVGQLDVLQVAEMTGRSPNWVRVTQHRALRRLADVLNGKDSVKKLSDPVIPAPSPAIYKA
ncbi:N/A [soil metagenome]